MYRCVSGRGNRDLRSTVLTVSDVATAVTVKSTDLWAAAQIHRHRKLSWYSSQRALYIVREIKIEFRGSNPLTIISL
jgi:hypothetical protein